MTSKTNATLCTALLIGAIKMMYKNIRNQNFNSN